jgi:prepilin peptidase CpaA
MEWSKEFLPVFLYAVLGLAAIYDLRFRKIPNGLTYPVMALAVAYHATLNGWGGVLLSLEGIGLGMALLILPFLMGGMGAGDVKLLGAVGGFLGPQGVFRAFLFIAIVGGVYAIVLLMKHGYLRNTGRRYWMILRTFFRTQTLIYVPPSPIEKKPQLIYGLAIALGTVLSLGPWELFSKIGI